MRIKEPLNMCLSSKENFSLKKQSFCAPHFPHVCLQSGHWVTHSLPSSSKTAPGQSPTSQTKEDGDIQRVGNLQLLVQWVLRFTLSDDTKIYGVTLIQILL